VRRTIWDMSSHSSSRNIPCLSRTLFSCRRLDVVHGVWLSPRNIAQIAEAGARVVHNPISNLRLKSGIAPILDLYRAGIDIALGCDNCTCAETQNIFTAMRMLCLLPAVTEPDPGPINAGYALKAATLSGARYWTRRQGWCAQAGYGGRPNDPRSHRARFRAVATARG
jgi:cytosine/adenosine deaminase-related metal-dependent hydrolase